ncbi:signal peptidase I [Patescibacteria group bacterium]|nr:signal peptidase I [Patescibacteria group bacterium]MBU1034306.1 signal peptidase I [Patescibacteria group bacterium]MBU1629572.1 signal peptidase I [Patescibacteria group bacterium]MBU1907568.1 signal peptidase I [Patescibacteria group bacterium]
MRLFCRRNDDVNQGGRKMVLGLIFELIQVAAISLAIIIPVRYFLIQPFYVKGASMEPNFFDHEYLIIDEISYRFSEPERGDIVVFRYPRDPSQFFIKRIIAMPEETVEIAGGQIKIFNADNPNGFVLPENEYLDQVFTATTRSVTLKADEYFVLGDNRIQSLDSRYFGPINRYDVVGRVWLRGWPLDRWKVFKQPAYQTVSP